MISFPGVSIAGAADNALYPGVVDGGRKAVLFNGLNQRGELAIRAVNPDGDNILYFFSPQVLSAQQGIISQNIAGASASMEFRLATGADGSLQVTFGGVTSVCAAVSDGFAPATRYKLSLIGSISTLEEVTPAGNVLVKSGAFTRGAAREPAAKTVICARGNNAGFLHFFSGLQYDVGINAWSWEMAEYGRAVQPSTPPGNSMTLFSVSAQSWRSI